MVCCYKDQMLVATNHLNRNIEDLNLMKLGNDKTNNDLISDFLKMYCEIFLLKPVHNEQILNTFHFDLGIIRFTQAVKMYEKQDEEIQQLNQSLKTLLIPSVTVIPSGPEQHNGS